MPQDYYSMCVCMLTTLIFMLQWAGPQRQTIVIVCVHCVCLSVCMCFAGLHRIYTHYCQTSKDFSGT